MRLDKFLTECGIGTRSEVKSAVEKGFVKVNSKIIKSSSLIIDETKDIISYRDETLKYSKYRYYALHKPAGVVTAVSDPVERTVMDILPNTVIKKGLSPAGRLDKDTEGLLILTNDGDFIHETTHPKSHVTKTYYVELEKAITDEECRELENGVEIDDGYITKPAVVERITESTINLTITEGRFHQVKKMASAVGNGVTYLKRVSFAKYQLGTLEKGCVKEIDLTDIL